MLRKFGLCRICVREMAHAGELPGVQQVLLVDLVVFTREALDAFLEGPIAVPTRAARERAAAGAGATSDEPVALAKAPAASEKNEPAAEEAPFGPGSHLPLEDGSEPDGFPIKGNADSMLYHVPGSAFYERTSAEVWFADAEAAEKAGFQLPPRRRSVTMRRRTSDPRSARHPARAGDLARRATALLDERQYTFVVRPDANKTQIKIAVEKVFGVKVLSVNTLNRNGKRKRTRTGYGKRKDTKRAIVTLSAESRTIDVFGGPAS